MANQERKTRFQCKYERCPYSEGSLRFFEKYQYLKQHYDKVHADKIYSCERCSKSFSTTTLLKSHSTYCGREFKCSCGVIYKSNEALLTHAKRKNHQVSSTSQRAKRKHLNTTQLSSNMSSVLVNIPKGAQLVILHPNSGQANLLKDLVPSTSQQSTQACSMHVMAAVALSELASSVEVNQAGSTIEKKEAFTQTENQNSSPETWLNLVSESSERIHSSGTQTEHFQDATTLSNPASPANPGSPWLGLSAAETQTADEDVVLRPFNLCNIQTQTPWNEINEDEESTGFAHSETQTLLSSFLNIEDSLPECQMERGKALAKQSSEDAGTDPMEVFASAEAPLRMLNK